MNTTTPGWQDRFFARCWSHLAGGIDATFRPHKDETLVALPDRIIEIGPGLGSNFRRYPAGASVLAFEPNRAMHDGLRRAAVDAGIQLEIRSDDLREAGLADGSVAAVVSTLVLCSVGDQIAMVREIHRILEPGGRFLFIEHVASEQPVVRGLQRAIRWPWGLVGDGCDPAPDTVDAIEAAGFAEVRATRDTLGSKLNPAHPIYWGVAIR
ncbi:MAG: class I SAM-dependent methyltransferase [Acidimicrobiales bacterium]